MAAIKAEPGYVEARLQLAHMLRRSGQFEASLAHYDYIVKADPRVPEARFGYAASLVRLRRYAEARDHFESAMRDYPAEARVRHRPRRVCSRPRPTIASATAGARSRSLRGSSTKASARFDVLETMAMAQAEVGQFSGAAMWQRDAIAAAEQTGRPGVAERITDNLTPVRGAASRAGRRGGPTSRSNSSARTPAPHPRSGGRETRGWRSPGRGSDDEAARCRLEATRPTFRTICSSVSGTNRAGRPGGIR